MATVVLCSAQTVRAEACPPTTVPSSQPELPAPWLDALNALVSATSRPGQPWSCGGAELSLVLSANKVSLRVRDASGNVAEREVRTADDLVATGEALLAVPTPQASAPASDAIDPPKAEMSSPAHDVAAAASPVAMAPVEPRFLIEGDAQTRYTSPTHVLWVGPALRGVIPFGPWSVDPWLRFDLPVWQTDAFSDTFAMSEVCLGLSLARRLVTSPLQVDAALGPSLAVVSMQGGSEPDLADGSKADVRLGLELRASWAFSEGIRGVFGIDGEIAPAAGSPNRRVDPGLPVIPNYTLGLTLGVQTVVR